MIFFKVFIAFQLAWIALCEKETEYKSRNMDPVSPEVWNLPPANVYDQIFEITNKNHRLKIMESDDAWIVVFYKQNLHKKWRDLAGTIGGAVWFGKVDVEKYPDLANKVKLDAGTFDGKTGTAVVYPVQRNKKRDALAKGELKLTSDTRQAELYASATIPDRSVDFSFAADEQQKFNDWVVKGYYYEQPSKFPVICLTDDTETPIHVKTLSHYLYTHFNFGIVRKSDVGAMRKMFQQVPEPQKYPTFLVLLGAEPSSEEMNKGVFQMRFNIMPFIEPKYGDSRHFQSLMNFLFVANDDYRKEMPGHRPDIPNSVLTMKEIRERLSNRVEIVMREETSKTSKKSEL